MRRTSWFAAASCLAVAVVFLALPVLAVFTNTEPGSLIASLGDRQAKDALRLSLETTSIAVV
jgi:molybdate transport system permease protein